jgi:hypothetical protein
VSSEVPAIDLRKPPEKDPMIDPGNPLGKDPVIDLGYTKYHGIIHNNGVTQWLGIRYAAPSIGDLRFVIPKNPFKHRGIQQADKVRLLV